MSVATDPVKIDKLIPGGQALGTAKDGKKIFFWNALPGEIVTKYEIVKSKSTFAEAVAIDFDRPSAHRISPRDDCFLSTSPWQILAYDYELSSKRELVLELFRQFKLQLPDRVKIAPVQTDGQDFFYRNKMEYALYFDHADNLIHPAFRGRGTHQKIPVFASSLEKPAIFAAAESIIAELNRTHADARQYQSLLLRANAAGVVSGGLFENHRPRPHFPELTDTILGHDYSYSPNGFFQINLPVYELALREIQRWIQSGPVVDLYSGVGTIGLSVAREADLTLVESDRAAFRELEANCVGTQAKAVFAKSEEALDLIPAAGTVIVDPPRAGCRPELLKRFLTVQPERIIYLSCNPATQCRDLALLAPQYEILSVTPLNFFPRTPHIENLVILEQKHAS